jgi:hypothetical protein
MMTLLLLRDTSCSTGRAPWATAATASLMTCSMRARMSCLGGRPGGRAARGAQQTLPLRQEGYSYCTGKQQIHSWGCIHPGAPHYILFGIPPWLVAGAAN